MDDLFNLAIYLIVGLVWLISVLGSKKKGQRFPDEETEFPFPLPFPPEPESKKTKEEPLPLPEIEELPSEAQIEISPAPAISASTTSKPQVVTAEEAEKTVYYKEIELPGFDISKESLEEGIILSALLGPPKGFKYFQRL